MKQLNVDHVTYPVSLKQIPRFERDNKLSINCYGFEKVIYPLYVSSQKAGKEIDLLLFKGHYYLIRNLSRLLASINDRRNGRRYVCRSCLSIYYSQSRLDEHKRYCANDGQRYSLPPPKTYKSFQNFRGQILNDFVIFFDMESAIISPAERSPDGKLKKIGQHKPIAIGAKRVSLLPEYDGELVTFTGLECVEEFFAYLKIQAAEIQAIRWVEYHDIDWTPRTAKEFHSATHCQLCGKLFSKELRKSADHHHLKAKDNYRGALCSSCNLTYASTQRHIPIIGHSALSYDVKHLLTVFAKKRKEKHTLKVLAKNTEKFHCLYLDQFMFIDSYSFLQGSLQTLTDSLRKKGEENFVYTKQFTRNDETKFRLLLRKGVMCYNYMDQDFELKFEEARLPRKEEFYDSLKKENISEEDYNHAQRVFEAFECTCLRDYLLVYLAADVLQLADVFTSFRKIFYKDFGLDATHYMSLPQLAFDALLKESKVRLELISDIDMYNWISHSVRGGFSGVLHREAVPNHRFMNTYDETLPDSYLMYFDVCNLYGMYAFFIFFPVIFFFQHAFLLAYVFSLTVLKKKLVSCRLYDVFKTDANRRVPLANA